LINLFFFLTQTVDDHTCPVGVCNPYGM